jgi:hypothetical protein
MYRKLIGMALGLALVWGAAPGPLQGQDDTFQWDGRMNRGQTLEVKGISGNITAVLASGGSAQVVAEKRGRRSDFDEVEIRMVEEGSTITVCALYRPWRFPENSCDYDDLDDRDDDEHGDIDVSVDFEVQVPAGVEFVGTTVAGDVEAREMESEVTATTVAGDVYVSTSEMAWATTVSGELEIEIGTLDWDDLHFNTVDGDITLYLPAGLAADVSFSSLSGDFDSEFDISMRSRSSRWIGSRIRGTIGDGGRDLSFRTISGDVRLKRAR